MRVICKSHIGAYSMAWVTEVNENVSQRAKDTARDKNLHCGLCRIQDSSEPLTCMCVCVYFCCVNQCRADVHDGSILPCVEPCSCFHAKNPQQI